MGKIKVRVEYESRPIRHLAVQCPACEKWFVGNDISNGEIRYEHDLKFAWFECPLCGKEFGYVHNSGYAYDDQIDTINEVKYTGDIYKDCLTKHVVWRSE